MYTCMSVNYSAENGMIAGLQQKSHGTLILCLTFCQMKARYAYK